MPSPLPLILSPSSAAPASLAPSVPGDWMNTLCWQHSFADLGEAFHTRLLPTPLPSPYLVGLSTEVAALLGIPPELAETPEFLACFTGSQLLPGSQPLASVYSGHQFGVWAGQLGDGRAILLGEIVHGATPYELQLKGAGPTPYSRRADGRAVLRSSIREFLCSEAMAGLGIPTTRALCVTGSDAAVRREETETAAVVTRVAASFIRFGHFEHFAHRHQHTELKTLADYVIQRFYPACAETPQPYLALLTAVAIRTADLLAHWQAVGFCHGVMNSDNMSILGLTLDYGPFGFLDAFNARHICNHSDTQGRYAYVQQPQVGYWNLACLAQALLPLIGEGESAVELARGAIEPYADRYGQQFMRHYRAKLGLTTEQASDTELLQALFGLLQANQPDYTLFFRHLADFSSLHTHGDVASQASLDGPVRDMFADRAAWDAWAARYRTRLQQEQSVDAPRAQAMRRVNPLYILRNHLAEIAIRQAKQKDFSEVERLLQLLRRPYEAQAGMEAYAALPPDWAPKLEISCSS